MTARICEAPPSRGDLLIEEGDLRGKPLELGLVPTVR
jgi:hypothetical protein